MDMLYARYSYPMDLIRVYIHLRRFGDFVSHFIQLDRERRQAEADKDEEWKMWTAYLHSHSDKSFNAWKAEILASVPTARKTTGGDHDLDEKSINQLIDHLFPSSTTKG